MRNLFSRKVRRLALGAGVVALGAMNIQASPLGYGIVVERDGGGADFTGDATAYDANGHPIFFDEFDATATGAQAAPIQTIAVPDTVSMLTNGTTTGFMTAGADGNYLVTSAFTSPVGTATPATANTSRTIVRMDLSGNVDTSTTYTMSSGSPRSTATADGSSFYFVGSAGGTRYVPTFGTANASTTSVQSAANRAVKLIQGRLFLSSTSTALPGGAGGVFELTASATDRTPPTTGAATVTTLTNSSGTPEGFTLIDADPTRGFDGTTLDTLYLADESSTVGGLVKYVLGADNTTWTAAYTLSGGLTSGTTTGGGLQDVAYVGNDASGNPVLFATTSGTSGHNALVRVVDGGAGSSFVDVVDAPTNTVFRGIAATPVPEPATLSAIGLAAFGVLGRRRKRTA